MSRKIKEETEGACKRARKKKRTSETSAARFNSTLMQSAWSSATVAEGYYLSLAETQQPAEQRECKSFFSSRRT